MNWYKVVGVMDDGSRIYGEEVIEGQHHLQHFRCYFCGCRIVCINESLFHIITLSFQDFLEALTDLSSRLQNLQANNLFPIEYLYYTAISAKMQLLLP